MDLQLRVSEFMEEHGLGKSPEFAILDLAAEVGEIAGDATKSSDWGQKKEELKVSEDEIGDALFSLLSVADALEIDAEEAFEKSMKKYRKRIEETGDPTSR